MIKVVVLLLSYHLNVLKEDAYVFLCFFCVCLCFSSFFVFHMILRQEITSAQPSDWSILLQDSTLIGQDSGQLVDYTI